MSVSRAPKTRGQPPDRPSGRSRRPPGKAVTLSAKGVAFYDLDGTLVDLNLVHAALFLLANLGAWSGRLKYLLGFAARLPRLYMAEQGDRRLLNEILFEAFKAFRATAWRPLAKNIASASCCGISIPRHRR
ncbi:MAG: hypothetical protein JO071_05720 [Deltaproteobacteria bacterium]|nr:hypothetical protein [Deltaproteobacteria bacterium]